MKLNPNCVLTAALFISLASSAQSGPHPSGTLMGRVADIAENVPITHAFVLIHGEGGNGDMRAEPDKAGKFRLTLAPGLYSIFVSAPGFAPYCKKIEIFDSRSTMFVARLGADNEHLQESRGD